MKSIKFYLTWTALLVFSNSYTQEKLPDGVSKDWYTKTAASIQQLQDKFYKTEISQQYSVSNTNNRLSFLISPLEYNVFNLKNNQAEENWNTKFSLISIGKDTKANFAGNSFTAIEKQSSLIYHSSLVDIEYVNNNEGLRQNFIINKRPAGHGNLSLSLQIQSTLKADEVKKNQLAFYTKENSKDIKLIYDQLKVWDVNNHLLAANMELDKTSNILTIIVDDKNASYPVTIDPLNRTPEWTTSADGILPGLLTNLQLQVQTTYGLTVAGLGDINGDGYDDVAVSAPTMADVVSGTGSLTGVGAVFIYLGSPAGLSTSPDKILQPTTAVSGALFGYSIDAGDVTGDGKNDIIIGAPLDSYQTNAAGLLGPTNVNVTAGKVYFYRSEDLFSAPNPSPFLQIRLQGTGFFSTGILNILQSNVTTNALFGYTVAITQDLNGDNKADILIGAPTYLGVDLLAVQSGSAFVYFSDNLATTSPLQLATPSPSLLGLVSLPIANTSGLLFGYSIDGAGDFNNDGYPDVVVGAPAGADLSSLGGIFSGQVLGGSAYVYYGTGTGVNATSTVRLQANVSGLLGNAANLFGYDIKGAENGFGAKTGNILVSAPSGSVLSNVLGGLQVKAGEVHVFKRKTPAATGAFQSDQTISSPRSSSILSILAGQTINVSMLFGASIDNMLDVNCDNIGDIIVGEPMSTAVPLIGADVVGGAAYVYLGNPDGTYNPVPIWDLYTNVSPLLGVNTTALMGYSVAGAGHVKGAVQGVRSLVGGPSNTLDFGSGLLNLGNTLGTTFDFAFDNNGLGKAYSFPYTSCNITLPTTLVEFSGDPKANKTVVLSWTAVTEEQLSHYELQKSTDGSNFETIALIFSKGAQVNEYSFIDKRPYNGINYYRLKMIDNDNKHTYSNIIIIQFTDRSAGDFVVTPNPVKGDINLMMNDVKAGMYRVELMNSAGQIYVRKNIAVSASMQKETITTLGLTGHGVYFLNVYDINNKKVKTIKVFLVNN